MWRRSLAALVTAALLGISANPALAAFTALQSTSVDTTDDGVLALAFTSNVAANSLILVALRFGDQDVTITSIADTRGTTYIAVDNLLLDTIGARVHVWQGLVTPGAGANTVTLTLSGASASTLRWAIHEFGSNGTQTQDVKNKARQASTTTPSSGSITPTTANQLIFGTTASGDAPTITATGSFTILETPPRLGTERWIQTTATATDVGFSFDAAGEAASIIVSYKQTAAGGGSGSPAPNRGLMGVGR